MQADAAQGVLRRAGFAAPKARTPRPAAVWGCSGLLVSALAHAGAVGGVVWLTVPALCAALPAPPIPRSGAVLLPTLGFLPPTF